MSERIRWESDGRGGFEGYAGTFDRLLFDVWQSPNDSGEVVIGEWVLSTQLPRPLGRPMPHGKDAAAMKAEAEKWLAEFVASLGAVFPEPLTDHQRLQRSQARSALASLGTGNDRGLYGADSGLADHLRGVLGILDQIAPEEG